MRRQSRLPASYVPLIVPWNQPQITSNLVERVCMVAQPLLPHASECAAVQGCKHMKQTQCEHIRRRLSVPRKGPVYKHALMNATHAVIDALRYLLRGTQQGETKLCQK